VQKSSSLQYRKYFITHVILPHFPILYHHLQITYGCNITDFAVMTVSVLQWELWL